ncbi:MAG: DUF2812 domain-containing protein [Firmicutes bacterium]|nr:DUF2812 domain-containing protein [Bacillota bacterium]
MRKTLFRFFTIADYMEEEDWLRREHQSGWKLISMTIPGIYTFESCTPEDVIYRLDFKNNEQTEGYMQMAADFGWEYFDQCMGWLYFRKPATAAGAEGDEELFSDNASKAEMAEKIMKKRFLPILIIFFCCLIPNMFNSMNGFMGAFSTFFTIFFGVMFVVYVFLILHCGIKLRKIRDQFKE